MVVVYRYLAEFNHWRFARTISFFVKHSWRRRDNNNETGTKSEGEDMAVFFRKVGECSMDGMVEEC